MALKGLHHCSRRPPTCLRKAFGRPLKGILIRLGRPRKFLNGSQKAAKKDYNNFLKAFIMPLKTFLHVFQRSLKVPVEDLIKTSTLT
jgi:hypothetical protein